MPLRWGICSAGKISHDFVVGLKALESTQHQVLAVAARSIDAAANFAEAHSIPYYYGSYAELAANTMVGGWLYRNKFCERHILDTALVVKMHQPCQSEFYFECML